MATWTAPRHGLVLHQPQRRRHRHRARTSAPSPLAPGSLAPPDYFGQRFYEAGGELSNRYINWTYPAKYYVGYTSRDVELTLGDFYAQFGRGLVLSVRKLDELSSDITIRGARATSHLDVDDAKLKLTLLGGEMNPSDWMRQADAISA